ncbi:Arc family DNA-binding protein [Propionispora sp. 2/2-37]|uniref:Arc family DNA-binding protein n=1 Tax=Propionispora sp. 2/2-37 TaxID=1677858 RepID=UPI0009E6E457|nr:Arc family DNA-binding protein [Propionispora sp. 2/2-37]
MKKEKEFDDVRMTFRIPADIYKQISESAKKNRRSLNNEMVIALEEFLKNTKTDK